MNKRRMLGAALVVLGLFTAFNGWSVLGWTLSYWDHEFVETYRGYDIYYFVEINVYGIDTGGDPMDWKFYGSLESARAAIDNWLEDPVYVESYRGWDIYREPSGAQRYYAVREGVETSRWPTLEELKAYIDGPIGFFRIDNGQAGLNDTIIVSDTTLAIDFVCTDRPDLVKRVYVVVSQGGATVLTRDLAGPLEVEELGAFVWGPVSVELPGEGVYAVEGYVDRYLEESRYMSVTCTVPGAETLYTRWAVGAIVSSAGLVLLVMPEKKRERRWMRP